MKLKYTKKKIYVFLLKKHINNSINYNIFKHFKLKIILK